MVCQPFFTKADNFCHGGESRDILYLYSDRMGWKIYHSFFNTW